MGCCSPCGDAADGLRLGDDTYGGSLEFQIEDMFAIYKQVGLLVWLLTMRSNFHASFKDLFHADEVLGGFRAVIRVGNVDFLGRMYLDLADALCLKRRAVCNGKFAMEWLKFNEEVPILDDMTW